MATSDVNKLKLTLLSDTEIVLTRVFDAPRRLVFEAQTSCEHMKHWWGPERYPLTECEMDFRVGGTYRYVERGDDGVDYVFKGEYREIVSPERIVNTFEFEGMPGQVSVQTIRLEETDSKTTLISTSVFGSVEERDAMLGSGMEEGAAETYDRLAEYLQTMT